MKKVLGIILVLVIMVPCCFAILIGCKPSTDYTHTIIFYSSQGDALQSVTANAIENFEKKYPGWKVEHVTPGGYDDVRDKIIQDFQGHQQPDVAYCYSDHVAQYLQTGNVIDMNKYIKSTDEVDTVVGEETVKKLVGFTEAEINDIVPGYYKEGLAKNYGDYESYNFAEDAMLTLPFVKSTELLYYNKTALDACGLTPATTWDELWAQCAVIKEKYPKATPLGYDSEANWFITMAQQNGWGYTSASAPHYLFNNENAVAWLTQLKEYYEKGYISTQNEYGSYTSALFTKGVANDEGGCVYCIGSSGGASHQDPGKAFTWGIAPTLGSVQADGSVNYSAISQGPSLVMLKDGRGLSNADEKEMMTWLFVKELLAPQFQAAFAVASGYNPARISAADYLTDVDASDITSVAAKVASSMSDRFFTSPAFSGLDTAGSSEARTQVGNVVLYSMTGKKTPEKALKDAVDNCGGNG